MCKHHLSIPLLGLLLSRCPRTIQVSTGAIRGRGQEGMSHRDKTEEGREGEQTEESGLGAVYGELCTIQVESVPLAPRDRTKLKHLYLE